AVAAAVQYLAIGNADVAAAEAIDEPVPGGQGKVAAVEREAGEPDMARAFAQDHCAAAGEDELRRAAHADELRAVGQIERAGAVDTGRQRQRHAGARGFVDGALQAAGLVLGTARPHAILRGVAPERARELRRARSLGRGGEGAGKSGGGGSDEMAAIEVHDRLSARLRYKEVAQKCGPARR